MSTLDEMATYLQSAGCGTVGTDLFKGSRPNAPDDLLCLYEYPGMTPEYVQQSFTPIFERPSVQVLTRSKDYEAARERAARAWSALSGVTNAELSGTYYRSIRPNGSPASLGRDANDRILIAFNCAVDKEVNLVGVS